jgi:inorganic pyrophosphatase
MSGQSSPDLAAWDSASGALNVIVETPKGSRNKYKYDPQHNQFELHRVLPRGMFFPFDFGFVPSTVGEDGDPLDVLVLMDEPVVPGCRVPCRLIGVVEAEQTEVTGEVVRNDRLIAVATHSHDHKDLHSLKEIHDHFVTDVANFFGTYHRLEGGDFRVIGRHGPNRAEKLVQDGVKHHRDHNNQPQSNANAQSEAKSQRNGKKKAKKK